MRRIRSRQGFTVVELMVAGFVFVLLSGILLQFMFLFHNLKWTDQVTMDLTNRSRQVVDEMLAGVRRVGNVSRYGLSEAQAFTIGAAGDNIQFTGSDGAVRTIRAANNNQDIEYVDNTGVVLLFDGDSNDGQGGGNNWYQANLTFAPVLPNVVRVDLVLSRRVVGRWYRASVSTQVALRN